MKVLPAIAAVSIFATAACGIRGERPPVDSPVIPPSAILNFSFLYSENCAGCHGPEVEAERLLRWATLFTWRSPTIRSYAL